MDGGLIHQPRLYAAPLCYQSFLRFLVPAAPFAEEKELGFEQFDERDAMQLLGAIGSDC